MHSLTMCKIIIIKKLITYKKRINKILTNNEVLTLWDIKYVESGM